MHFHSFEARGIALTLDLRVGHIRHMALTVGGRSLEPLHTAPWVDDPAVLSDETITPNARLLSGDFFCAPFGRNDIEDNPTHGAPANSPWILTGVTEDAQRGGVTARYELQRLVMGASVIKELRIHDDHPFVYERHIFKGGAGALPVANHAMTRIEGEAVLGFSRKAFGLTPQAPMETDPRRGRSVLAYPARFEDMTKAPLAGGGLADLTRYPFAERHEEFVILVEEAGPGPGWTVVARRPQNDVFISLKNAAELPFTFLWVSNGGRDYRPWDGRHIGVLGVEDARAFGGYGHRASMAPNEFSDAGIPTALSLDPQGEVQIRNVIGGLPLPDGWTSVADIRTTPDTLTLVGAGGQSVSYPFDGRFLD
jgi:hypothetical protein